MDEIQESNEIFHEVWAMYAQGLGGEVVEKPGLVAAWAGVQWPMVNVVFLAGPIQNVFQLRSRLDSVAVYTKGKKQFGMLVACDSWLPSTRTEVAALFNEYGWVQISEGAGMLCEKPTAEVSVQALEYRRVDSKELRQAAADINAARYGVPAEMAREALDREALGGEGCFGYVGYFNGQPVATSTTYVRNGYLYVALVSTLPEFRSRSFAKAITIHSINEASKRSGLQRTMLHATPMARSMYESLGFRTVTTFPMFLPVGLVAPAEAH